MKRIEILGLQTIPQIQQGDNLAEVVLKACSEEVGGVEEKDIIVLTSKIVSKAQGRVRKLEEVTPGKRALDISRHTGKDAKWLQMIFDEGHKIAAILPVKGVIEEHILNAAEDNQCARELCEHEQAVCITVGPNGAIHTCDAGIDGSNNPPGTVSLLPEDPDRAAREIREEIQKLTGKKVAVILADTEMVPFGTMDVAVGSSGIEPRTKMFGKIDNYGRPKFGGVDLTANEMCSAAALLFGQVNAGIPVAIIRGYEYQINETENISNCLWPKAVPGAARKAIRQTIRATSYAFGPFKRLLLRVACWFI